MTQRDDLNITFDSGYSLLLRWQPPIEGRDYLYEVELLADDPAFQPQYPLSLRTYSTYADVIDLTGFYVQENGYTGEMHFRITAFEDDAVILQDESDHFRTEDIIPKQKELHFGSDIDPRSIWDFSYSGSGDHIEANFSYGFVRDDEEITYTAHYHDESGEHEKTKTVSRQEWEAILARICDGRMVIRYFENPEYRRLDGSDEQFSLQSEDLTDKDQKIYEYEPADREALIDLMKNYAK